MQRKNKVYIAVGSIIGIFVFLYIGYSIFSAYGSALDQESKSWVDETAPEILTSWDPNEIARNASPEWFEFVSDEANRKFSAEILENFGVLTDYKSSTGEASINFNINNLTLIITAEYVVEADFTKGPARVFIRGIKKDGTWKIYSLHVDTNPNLRWYSGQLTDQPVLEKAGDSATINGVHYRKLLDW